MKQTLTHLLGCLVLGSVLCAALPVSAQAETSSTAGNGHVRFAGDEGDGLVKDPEHPDTPVDPGESPRTNGDLRIEFVPQLSFSANRLSSKDTSYPVNAQLFHDGTAARGNFIQISDYRGGALGWTLQLRQEMQFYNPDTPNRQLDGAVLSLDQAWTNSAQTAVQAPVVSKEVIHLDNIGSTYNLAEAAVGTGSGTWSISFGASAENPLGLTSTLTPKITEDGQPVVDAAYENQQVYENSAIKLSIPGATKKDPVTYTTVLTWILAELP
ncbi:WxL domain-containing protein [Enterococcus sp. BWB1-3]|uniref:WxL domain-containing protein n=1 Tax=unclassified Enterococcus TaxID=2608891 RepID=UPI0019232FDA|nr:MULTISPECIES: WxL domain-containing protein [unclassified Enterococcus]MBL1229138.1 WxL domain-containing protein [Enterococcus sp. BWB1-3]MCB5952518.1 WxL domain-containing protein [Enterococcus sp. BWT-B8]MCB5953441.1 WxL domain-containing protein [Enterococcus sp. CWB-B31]